MSEEVHKEWCINPIEIKNALWTLADKEQESTVVISPRVFIRRTSYVLRKYRRYEILWSDPKLIEAIREFWIIANECSENFEDCYQKLSVRFKRISLLISRIFPGEQILREISNELKYVIKDLNDISNTYNIRFVVDWSRYRPRGFPMFYAPIPTELLAGTLALGFGLSMSLSLEFLEFRKGIASIRGRVDAIIQKGKSWYIRKGPTLIVLWDCIKGVASDTYRDKTIGDLLNKIIPLLGDAILFTRDVISCIHDNEYIVISK
ncbi:hypothetical protein A3L04_08445 [Thermococcus chitonophagus]|uniref:Uncharacterized protein n=1 Tax=Thermococcus chitonophagus TaxID=54262 RepID=A0A160VSP8_9EURY|nr:hypothetical protein [Thermococcus chitonophagus]ASJ17094.1 hypothetical protein A3L04_08445 [Thermococcus chitonophagus]CUX77699.1 hypothetical protein CHITON_0920 [Thermococcus chitonophagus]